MYGLEKVNYSSLEECAKTIKQIADGLQEDRDKLKKITEGLTIEDFNIDATTIEFRDAVNGVLFGVEECIRNLDKYSVHLTNVVVKEFQDADNDIGSPLWNKIAESINNN